MQQWQWRRGTALFGAFTAVLLLIGLFWPASGSNKEVKKASANATSSTSTTTTVAPTPDSECPKSWGRSDSDKAGNRWIAEGIPAIRNAKTEAEARKGIREWTNVVRKDPALFAGAVRYILDKDVAANELFNSSGCATSKAVDLLAEMETALALSSIKPDQAPETGYNSGADPNGGGVHVAGTPGIKGERAAARIDLPDGTVVWIMARCGNPVTMKPPSGVPHGPTDNNPPPPTTTTSNPPGETTSTTQPRTTTTRPTTTSTTVQCPPGMHGTPPVCKDDPSRDPEPRGNNRPGGGGTAPPITGAATPPEAGPPPATYVPPPPPTAPSTTRPTGSTAPPAPSTTTTPTTGPPVTSDPGPFS